jgi:hypothetical protein
MDFIFTIMVVTEVVVYLWLTWSHLFEKPKKCNRRKMAGDEVQPRKGDGKLVAVIAGRTLSTTCRSAGAEIVF